MSEEIIKKERIKYSIPMLHFEECDSMRALNIFPEIPWHWHTDFELSFVSSGQVEYRTMSKNYVLSPGDVVFINSSVIHAVTPIEPRDEVHHYSHFFDNYFISGGEGNIFDAKYVLPLQTNEDVDMLIFRADDERFEFFHTLIKKNMELMKEKPLYYEFELRENVSKLWQIILGSLEDNSTEFNISKLTNKRLKITITFIQKHYREKISLEDIADKAHISVRECNRMFNKYLKVSPISFLNSIRIQKATSMLLDENKSIVQIALENGYTSSSHFGKKFKEYHGMTPNEYRKKISQSINADKYKI